MPHPSNRLLRRPQKQNGWPSISQRRYYCGQSRYINCARNPHLGPGCELNLDHAAGPGGRRRRLLVRCNGDCRKTDLVISPLDRPRLESKDALRAYRRRAVTRLR